jgi:diacylglycerol O-acyltransferase / wax synthase
MRRLSGLDAQMLYIDTPRTPNQIAAIWTYDQSSAPRPVTFEDVLETVRSRLHLARAFRERLATVPWRLDFPYWINDPDFDLEFHVRSIRLPAPGDWRQLCTLLARLHSYPLDLSRPPWEFYFIEGLDTIPQLPSGSFATMLKVHHAAVDGKAGLEMSSALHDEVPDAGPVDPPTEPWEPDLLPSSRWLLRRGLVNNVRSPVRAVGAFAGLVPLAARAVLRLKEIRAALPESAPHTRFNTDVTGHPVLDMVRFPLSDVKVIRQAVPGSTVNDVILAISGGGLRRYLQAKSELPDESLVAIMPISQSSERGVGTGGNEFSMVPVSTATNIADPLERVAAVARSTAGMKAIVNALGARAMIEISEAMPGALMGLASRFTASSPGAVNLTVTNVPGRQTPLYFCGARAVDAIGAGPLPHGMALIHLVGSYGGNLYCSVMADREVMPDPQFYAQCLKDAFDELLRAAAAVDESEQEAEPHLRDG